MPGFDVSFDPQAGRDLERHPALVQSAVLDWIEQCAKRPSDHALRPSFPHILLLKFETFLEVEGKKYHALVLFQYATDEQTLHIRGIAVSAL